MFCVCVLFCVSLFEISVHLHFCRFYSLILLCMFNVCLSRTIVNQSSLCNLKPVTFDSNGIPWHPCEVDLSHLSLFPLFPCQVCNVVSYFVSTCHYMLVCFVVCLSLVRLSIYLSSSQSSHHLCLFLIIGIILLN